MFLTSNRRGDARWVEAFAINGSESDCPSRSALGMIRKLDTYVLKQIALCTSCEIPVNYGYRIHSMDTGDPFFSEASFARWLFGCFSDYENVHQPYSVLFGPNVLLTIDFEKTDEIRAALTARLIVPCENRES